jgi:hypothetical protein
MISLRITSVSATVIGLVVGLALSCTSPGSGACDEFPATSVAACPEIIGEGFCSEGAMHLDIGTEITWDHEPPHSGNHYGVWETMPGEHSDVVDRRFWVHNLEHGWVVLIYNCPDGCAAELDVLREVLTMRPNLDIIMTEDPLLEGSRFAAISWTWVHAFDQPVLEELLCFVDQHYDNSPESVH